MKDSRHRIGGLVIPGVILWGLWARSFMVETLGHNQDVQSGYSSDVIEFYQSLAETFHVRVMGLTTVPLQPVPVSQTHTLDETIKAISAQQGDISWYQVAPDLLAVGPIRKLDRQVNEYLLRARDVILQRAQGLIGFLGCLEPGHRQFLRDNWFLPLDNLNAEEKRWLLAAIHGEPDVTSLSDRLKERWQQGWGELQEVRILLVFWPIMSVIGRDGHPLSEEVTLAMPQRWHEMYGYEMPDHLRAWQQQVGWQPEAGIRSAPPDKRPPEPNPSIWQVGQEISEERFQRAIVKSRQAIPADAVVTVEMPLYALDDIAHLFSQQTGQEVYIEAESAPTRIYITPGTYPASDFLVALAEASGLAPREVGPLLFLSSTAGPLSAAELRLLRGAAYADRRQFWREHLGFLMPPGALLQAVGSVFPSQWLEQGKEASWAELSPAQQLQVKSSFPGLRTADLEGGYVVFSPGFMLRVVGLVEEYIHPRTGLPFRSYAGSSRLFY